MSDFHRQLHRIRLLLQAGRMAAALLSVAALVALLWLVFGLLDLGMAFEPAHRTGITWVLAGISFIALAALVFHSLKFGKQQAAKNADALLGDSRNTASSALSLENPWLWRPAAASDTAAGRHSHVSPMSQWLVDRTLASAAGQLASIKTGQTIPWRLLKKSALPLLSLLAILGGLRLAAPAPFSTISQRLLHPGTDIPPYSHLVFHIEPENPQTIHGGEILLTATITGGKLAHPVECLIRRTGKSGILRLPAFRETTERHSHKLDGLTEPVQIAFACGKARSKWIGIEILLEPRILSGTVHLTPPPHARQEPVSFPLDTNEIAAIEGSTITLELISNRPLASGAMAFTSAAGNAENPGIHPASIPAQSTATFTWTATASGTLNAIIKDLRGTPCAAPLNLSLRLIPDQAPLVDLHSPPRQLLATPGSVIPVSGTARDDFGLSKLQFVRTLAGFRDRVRVVAPALQEKTYEFEDRLDLHSLGLEAGQIIELMLEASDHNPSLLGHGSSEISRIKIISEEEYAEYIRAKTTTEEFAARFQSVREALDKAAQALEELRDADGENAEEAKQDAIRAHREAAELLEKIAGDFPAFELEKRLQELARRQAEELRKNLEELEQPEPDIEEMLERLGRHKQEQQELDDNARFANDVAQLLEMAVKFREIYENQASLAKRLKAIVDEFRQGDHQNRRLLPSLAETQRKNREALDDFKRELRKRAEILEDADPALAPLLESALEFLQELELAQPETLMDAASEHGKAGQANDAFTNAELARALLERLLSEPEPFPQAAMGQAPQFEVPRMDVNDNIQQMLEAMLGRLPGQGQQQGAGGQGQGGFGPDGAAMSGYSMNLPVIGPDRLRFDPLSASSGGADAKGKTGPAPALPETAEPGTLESPATRKGEASTHSPESIPEPYREAVKRYFTP